MSTGSRIKQLRTKLGLSQEELGEKIGVQKAAIHKYESGIVKNLKQSIIKSLAAALETSPAYLMGWTDKPFPKGDASALGEEDAAEIWERLVRVNNGKALTNNQVKALLTFIEDNEDSVKRAIDKGD